MDKFEIRDGYNSEEDFWYIHDNETGDDYGSYSTYENAVFALKNFFN